MILALAVGFGYFGFGSSLFLGFVLFCFLFFFFFFFFFYVVLWLTKESGGRWLRLVVVVVGLADVEVFVVFFVGSMIYYFIVRNILFYCDVYIILLY